MQQSTKCNEEIIYNPLGYGCASDDTITSALIHQPTGAIDSTEYFQDSYEIRGVQVTPDSTNITFTATHNYFQDWQYYVVYTDTLSLDTATIGAGLDNADSPFSTNLKQGRTQFIWKAGELTGAGLTAGDISGTRMFITSAGIDARLLTIKMKHSSKSELLWDDYEPDGFTEVYEFKKQHSKVGQNGLFNGLLDDGLLKKKFHRSNNPLLH